MLHNMLRAAAGRDRIPTDGLIAWYTMDNISGTTLVDEMGNYDGTIYGSTQVPGVTGQALGFDGSNDYVDCGQAIDCSTDFTLSFFGMINNAAQDQAAFYKGVNTRELFVSFDSSGILIVRLFYSGSSGSYLELTAPAAINEFTHIAIERDGSTLNFYTGETLADSGTITGTVLRSPQTLQMGRYGGGILYLNGAIDRCFIYNQPVGLSGVEMLNRAA